MSEDPEIETKMNELKAIFVTFEIECSMIRSCFLNIVFIYIMISIEQKHHFGTTLSICTI